MATPAQVNDVTAALEDRRLASQRKLASAGLALLLVPSLWFIRTDFELYGHDWVRLRQRLAIRAILIGVPLAGILVMRAVRTRSDYSRAVLWLSLVVAVVTIGLNLMRPTGSGLPLRSPLLVVAILYFAMQDTPPRQFVAPLALSAALVAMRLTFLYGGGIDAGGDVVAILVLNAVGILAVVRRARLEAATNDVVGELKALWGIIPICSHCRKVRSEVGDWQQLERYVHERSDAMFSHGICPECLQEHYKDET